MNIGSWNNPYLGKFLHDNRLALLSYCLMWFLITRDLNNKTLEGVLYTKLPFESGGWIGGDPGWEIEGMDEDGNPLRDEKGHCIYKCWADSDISGIEPDTAYYTVEEVRYYIKLALQNLAKQCPEKKPEVDELLQRYHLLEDTWQPKSSTDDDGSDQAE
jgi:hypothetical protein